MLIISHFDGSCKKHNPFKVSTLYALKFFSSFLAEFLYLQSLTFGLSFHCEVAYFI